MCIMYIYPLGLADHGLHLVPRQDGVPVVGPVEAEEPNNNNNNKKKKKKSRAARFRPRRRRLGAPRGGRALGLDLKQIGQQVRRVHLVLNTVTIYIYI